MESSTAGRLLVATPTIMDGIFDQAVVFMLHHDPVGALGVIINDPSPLQIDELLPRWADLAHEPAVIFGGGPVEPNGFIGIAHRVGETDESIAAPIGQSEFVTVDLDADPAIAVATLQRLRIFRGYAGWSPGQLDTELALGAWFVLDAEPADLWSHEPTTLYETVLRRQHGEVRWFANAPSDPRMN